MKVIVAGGGTGGHIYPALAIAEKILTEIQGSEVLYVGCENGLENNIVPKTKLPFKTISAKGIPREISTEVPKAILATSKGVFEANRLIKSYQPDLVIGTGGFVCGPTVLMAVKNHIPTIIHEQNAYPGVTNKILAPMVSKVLVNYPEAKARFKKYRDLVITGLPVRNDIAKITHEEGCAKYGLNPERKTILITGGSRGARTINRVCALALPTLLNRSEVQVIFITGKNGFEETTALLKENGINPEQHERLCYLEYSHDMPYALAAADVIIGRAGATFLAEIAMCGLPGILIPYPYASENHQEFNARALVDAGAAQMILDGELTVPKLIDALEAFLYDEAYYQSCQDSMKSIARPNALDDILAQVKEYDRN